MSFTRRWCFLSAALFGLIVFASQGLAQTGPDLIVKPWNDGQMFDTSTDAVLESSGPEREAPHDDVQLNSYHAFGRYRVLPDKDWSPVIGYDVSYFDVNSHDKGLPNHLWDTEVGFAQPVATINKYFVVLTGTVGYAGDTPYSDPHAVYYAGNVIVGRKFSQDKAILIALNYNGNRTFLPDCPIPGIAYADRYNEHLTYVIGIPYDSIIYEPTHGVQFNLGYEYLSTFAFHAGWEFMKHYSLFTSYTDRLSAFHLSERSDDHRLFLQEHRAEGGFRWNPTELIKLSVGGGWAFGQEFARGFDTRGLNPIRHLRDGPFVEGLLEIGL